MLEGHARSGTQAGFRLCDQPVLLAQVRAPENCRGRNLGRALDEILQLSPQNNPVAKRKKLTYVQFSPANRSMAAIIEQFSPRYPLPNAAATLLRSADCRVYRHVVLLAGSSFAEAHTL